jgi:DNA polymerase (family 10)
MAKADTQQVAGLLREYAQRTALRGGNPYRAKAYSRAADSLAALAIPLDVLIAEGRLTEIPGVGDAIADIIAKLHRTGTHPSLERLRKEIPAGVLEMLSVPGLRPEKVLRLEAHGVFPTTLCPDDRPKPRWGMHLSPRHV